MTLLEDQIDPSTVFDDAQCNLWVNSEAPQTYGPKGFQPVLPRGKLRRKSGEFISVMDLL